jgi:hypothetical protein
VNPLKVEKSTVLISSEIAVIKDLEKGFQNLNGFGADISTKTAADKFKRLKRLKT